MDGLLDYLGSLVPLSSDEREQIGALAERRALGAGEHLLLEGDPCDHVAFVGRGLFRVYFLRDGDDRTAYFAPEGQFVSDYVSFLSGEPSAMNVQAVEPADLLLLSRTSIESVYRDVVHGERLGRLVAERLFVAAQARFASFYLDSAEDRYRRLIREHPGLVQRVPQHLVASYVGVRPPSLSRIRRRIVGG